MQELGLVDVFKAIEKAFADEDIKRAEYLIGPAVEQYPDVSQLWFYTGCLYFKTGRPAVASQMFLKAIELDDAAHIYSNLGACYRRMNRIEDGRAALQRGLDRMPRDASILTNMGSTYVNEGEPEKGIPYLEAACEVGTERGARWNLGLLYLEAGRFAEGFDCYRQGVTHERMVRSYGSDKHDLPEPKILSLEDPRAGKTLIVWGEQGIGDELMFGTCLADAVSEFGRVIFECHPRLEQIHRLAHPGLEIYPTRKEEHIQWPIQNLIRADYKCGIGDLAALYRREPAAFTRAWQKTGPTYRWAEHEQGLMREQLRQLSGGKPIVGLATHGGVMQTARNYRTLRPKDVDALFSSTDCMFVSLDYDDMLAFAGYVTEKFGFDRYKWWPAVVQHYDYDHVASLVGACDLVVTVCQSVAHLSASMGVPTRVLTPKRCAWRYAPVPGMDAETWYWYPDPAVKLYRQSDPESWDAPMARAIADIQALS